MLPWLPWRSMEPPESLGISRTPRSLDQIYNMIRRPLAFRDRHGLLRNRFGNAPLSWKLIFWSLFGTCSEPRYAFPFYFMDMRQCLVLCYHLVTCSTVSFKLDEKHPSSGTQRAVTTKHMPRSQSYWKLGLFTISKSHATHHSGASLVSKKMGQAI